MKDDSYFTTGQVKEETDLNDGNPGLPASLPGKFSVGKWIFTFNAYTSAEMSDEYLFYQGTGNSVTLSSGGENTVSVTVELYEAVKDADEDGNTYGTLVVYGITFTNQDGETQALSDITLWYSIDGGDLTEDADQAMLASSSESGLTFEKLEPGSHTFYAYVTDTSGTVLASGSASDIVKPNLTTTITGSIEEAEDATTSVTLGSLSVSYGSISVSSEEGLTAALSDSEVSTVTLTSSITLSSSLSVTSDTTIDLNGNELTLDSSTYLTASGNASLTLEGGDSGKLSASTSGAIRLKDGASLTIDGGTYTSTKNYLIYANADSADSTAAISVSNASLSSDGYYTICAVNGNTDITIESSTVTAGSYAAVCNQSGETMTLTLKDSTITSTSTTGYGMYNASGNMSITLDNTTVTSTKQAIYSVSGETALSISDGSSVTSTSSSAVSSTGSKLTVEMSGGNVSGGTYGINSGAATTAISVSGGTISGTDYGISISNGCTSGTVEITGGSISGGDYSLVVGGDIEPNEDGVSISISGSPAFTGQVYLGGYATTTIAGGTFYDESMPALHMRSGNLSISGGTFGTGLTGTSYDYAYTNSGSVEQPATVVIEAAGGGFGDLGTVSITGGTFNDLGLGYFVNPAYDGSAPSVSVDSTVSYTSYSNFKYRRSLTKTSASSASGYAYFLDTNSNYSSFSGTVTLDGTEYTVGDLETATETDGAYSF